MDADETRARAVFLAAIAARDSVEQAAILDRECAGDPGLRGRVEALLREHRESAAVLDELTSWPPEAAPPSSHGTVAIVPPSGSEHTLASDSGPGLVTARARRGRGRRAALARIPGALLEAGVTRPIGPSRGAGGARPGRLRHRGAGLRRDAAARRGHQGAGPANWRPPRRPASGSCARPAPPPASGTRTSSRSMPSRSGRCLTWSWSTSRARRLQQRLDQTGPLEVADVLRIGGQIARGLAAAHEQGLIHRDIKPANILLESGVEQKVKITDFGLARAADDASLTQSGVIAGTPHVHGAGAGQGRAARPRADLFSLGSVLYTMASGRPPFRAASTLAVLKRVAEDTPRPIRQIIPEVPQWLCDIIAKLHAKDPAHRFQSAAEVAALLEQHLAHLQQPSLAARPESVRVPRRRGPRRAAVLAGAAVVLGGLVAVIAYSLWRPAGPTSVAPGPDGPGNGARAIETPAAAAGRTARDRALAHPGAPGAGRRTRRADRLQRAGSRLRGVGPGQRGAPRRPVQRVPGPLRPGEAGARRRAPASRRRR